MTSSRSKHEALTRITDLRYQSVQLEMAKLLGQERALRRNLMQLVQQKQTRSAQLMSQDLASLTAGVDLRWHHWIDQRQTTINLELAQVLAQQAEMRVKLKNAFGKSQVAQALSARAASHDRLIKDRRARYES